MDYLDQWDAISARIKGLSAAAQLHASFLQVTQSDSFGRAQFLTAQCCEIFSDLAQFLATFKGSLPVRAKGALESFLSAHKSLFQNTGENPDMKNERNRAILVMLSTLETQLSFLLHDIQPTIKGRSELAFAHLQRLIVADADFRLKWQSAYSDGETSCEALGAVHLLSHGLYAFKISSAGARTDLVFQDTSPSHEVESASGLILTEWKKATAGKIESAFSEARKQADLYAPGVLSGKELRSYRYAVVVSDQWEAPPADMTAKEVTYRHILISVNPSTPSKQARKKPST